MGLTRASVQSDVILPRSMEIWNRWMRPGASSSAASLRSLPGILSGPDALWDLIFLRSFATPFWFTFMDEMLGVVLCSSFGRYDLSSLMYTEENCWFRMLALFLLLQKRRPSFFKETMPTMSRFHDLMKCQNLFGIGVSQSIKFCYIWGFCFPAEVLGATLNIFVFCLTLFQAK